MKLNDDIVKLFLVIANVAMVCVIIFAVVNNPELKDNTLLIHIIGVVEGAYLANNNFFFGSSKSSQDKDKNKNHENPDN
ncbi:MAG: hypothetical protein ACTSPC_13195 [Candidatus Heimdallarchaeota archaeon]